MGRCDSCNSKNTDVISTKSSLKSGGARDVTNVICNQCGLIFNDPMPSSAELVEYYSGGFAEDKNLTQSNLSSCFEKLKGPRMKAKNMRAVHFIDQYIKKGTRVLDVGCSFGELLSTLGHEYDCKVTGIEPDKTMAKIAKEYFCVSDIREQFFEDFFKESHSPYDMVVLQHVFEHLLDINIVIEELKKLMTPTGYLFLAFPSAHNLDPRRPVDRALEYGHLHTFSPFAIYLFLMKHQLKIVKWNFDNIDYAQQVLATHILNPVDAVEVTTLPGTNIKSMKEKINRHGLRHALHRITQKGINIAHLRWTSP